MLSTEPIVGLDLTTLRSLPELKPRVECLTDYATQVPQDFFHLNRELASSVRKYLNYVKYTL